MRGSRDVGFWRIRNERKESRWEGQLRRGCSLIGGDASRSRVGGRGIDWKYASVLLLVEVCGDGLRVVLDRTLWFWVRRWACVRSCYRLCRACTQVYTTTRTAASTAEGRRHVTGGGTTPPQGIRRGRHGASCLEHSATSRRATCSAITTQNHFLPLVFISFFTNLFYLPSVILFFKANWTWSLIPTRNRFATSHPDSPSPEIHERKSERERVGVGQRGGCIEKEMVRGLMQLASDC